MHGRSDLFNRDISINRTNNYGATNYQPNNNPSSTGNYSGNQQLGSYRLEYKYEPPSALLISICDSWKPDSPVSIITKQQTIHMSITELRIEDYFMIRNKQLRSTHDQKLKKTIQLQAFNQQLLRFNSHKLPPISQERPPDLDAIRNGRYNTPNNTNNNSSSTNFFRNNSQQSNNSSGGNIPSFGGTSFNGQGNTSATGNNIFASNSGSSNNIFMKNSNGANTASGTNNNSTHANIFNTSSAANNNKNGNIFGPNNNTNTGSSNNNNIFVNSTSNNNGNGPNVSNNNNASSNNSVFNRGTVSNQQTNNTSNYNNNATGGSIFANNNNANNAANRMFNNTASNQNNSLFNNNNSTTNNNLFPQNNNGSNSLFNNPNNASHNSQPPSLFPNNNSFQLNLQALLYQNRQLIQMLVANQTGEDVNQAKNNKSQQTNNQKLSLFDQSFPQHDFMQIDSHIRNRRDSPQGVIYIVSPDHYPKNKWNPQRNYSHLGQTQRIANNFGESRISNGQRQIANNLSSYNEGNKINKSKIMFNQSRVISNSQFGMADRQRQTYNRNQTMNRQTIYREQTRKSEYLKQIVYEYECDLELRLKVVWLDDLKNQITHQDRCTIVTSIYLPHGINTNNTQSIYEIVKKLKQKYPFIRSDAQLFINNIMGSCSPFSMDGKLEQRIINLNGRQGGEGYNIYYSTIKNNQLFNLTISNTYGTVSWDKPVSFDLLDFQLDNLENFSIENNSITCEVASLDSACRVTFNDLPDKYKAIYKDSPQQAKNKFQEQLTKMSKNFVLSQIWDHGDKFGWSMAVKRFGQDEEASQ